MSQIPSTVLTAWPGRVLQAAGWYHLLWGAAVGAFSASLFRWAGLASPVDLPLWQSVGGIQVLCGVACLLAARNPARRWPVVAAALAGTVIGAVGASWGLAQAGLTWSWRAVPLLNGVLWWVPLAAVLFHAFRQNTCPASGRCRYDTLDHALRCALSHRGATLRELSRGRRVLVVFLRHAGCTFCREALADLAAQRRPIEAAGVQLALVHMGAPLQGTQLSARFAFEDVHRFEDPGCSLYRAFGLPRGTFRQVLGWRVWKRGLRAAVLDGHGIGVLAGDGFQLPGVFLIENGAVVYTHRADSAADRPDYAAIACLAPPRSPGTDLPRRLVQPRELAEVA